MPKAMSDTAALSGTFSDFRIVKGRKIAQLVVEIPLEEADRALKILGGVPLPDVERWVAVARLNPERASSNGKTSEFGSENEGSTPSARAKPHRRWSELPRSQQAAIACHDPQFQAWVTAGAPDPNEEDAAALVRMECRVDSRRELDTDPVAGRRWDAYYTEYLQATGRLAEARS